MKKILGVIGALLVAFWLVSNLVWKFKPEWMLAEGVKREDVTDSPVALDNPLDKAVDTVRHGNAVFNVLAAMKQMEQEYQTTGTLAITAEHFADIRDATEVLMRLNYLRDRSETVGQKTQQPNGLPRQITYYRHKGQPVAVSLRDWLDKDEQQTLTVNYTYLNGRPIHAELILNSLSHEDTEAPYRGYGLVGSQAFFWQPDGSRWLKKDGTALSLPADYRDCQICYAEASALIADTGAQFDNAQYIAESRRKATAVGARRSPYVQMNNVAALMPRGMLHNSLVVGYDTQGMPEKVYYSFGDGKHRHDFQYLLENGRLFYAQSSTIALAADGVTADGARYHVGQEWIMRGNEVMDEQLRGSQLPAYPLDKTQLMPTVQWLAGAAQGHEKTVP